MYSSYIIGYITHNRTAVQAEKMVNVLTQNGQNVLLSNLLDV